MEKSRNLGPLLIILVVILVAVGAYIQREGKWQEVLSKVGINLEDRFVLQSQAGVGEVVRGFPTHFLGLVADAKVVESAIYTDRTDEERVKRVVIYETGAGISDMFAAYLTYLADRGYVISRAVSQGGETRIVANKNGETLSISMRAKSLKVNIVEIGVLVDVLE